MDTRTPDQRPTLQSSLQHAQSIVQEALTSWEDLGPSLVEQMRIFLELSDEALAAPFDGRPSFWPGDMARYTNVYGSGGIVEVKKVETRWDKSRRPHLVYRVVVHGESAVFVAYANQLSPLSELDRRVLKRSA